MKNIKIIVAAHKKYDMPDNNIYLPVFVGANGKEDIDGYRRDDTGDNISIKNPNFCELTGLHWAWKNLDADYIGLVHYRRYFKGKKCNSKDIKDRLASVLNDKQLEELLKDVDVVLPKKRNYYIENLYSHYKHTTYVEPLDETGKIIKEKYPDYEKEFNNLKKRRSAHMFNMLIMKKEILDEYCKWLFNILFELEKRVDITQYDRFHARFIGRISELLLDVWINTNNIKYKEVKVIDIEPVNWLKKGTSFIKAKIIGKKYEKSL